MADENSNDKVADPKQAKPSVPVTTPAVAAVGRGGAQSKTHSGENARFEGFLAEIVGVEKNRTGIYGEIKQALCKIMEGRDKGRVIRRNFAGRIKKGDIIRLPDTSREDKRIVAR